MNANCVTTKAKGTRRVLSGASMSVSGAAVWACLCLVGPHLVFGPGLTLSRVYEAVCVVVYALAVTIWFVAPIGGLIGFFLPPHVEGLSRHDAFWLGVRVGAAVGLLVAVVLAAGSAFPSMGDVFRVAWIFGRTMVPVCAVWVGVWILHWTRKPKGPGVIQEGNQL
jgi:hypothetical protein